MYLFIHTRERNIIMKSRKNYIAFMNSNILRTLSITTKRYNN